MSTSTETSTDVPGVRNVYYEDKRDEIVASFREELHKAGFSIQDKDVARILDKRHQKIVRRHKSTPQEQSLSEDDIELLKQHRLLKKRLRSLCDDLVVKREDSAVKIQETARSYHQAVHETLLQKKQKLDENIKACKSTTAFQASSDLHVSNETNTSFENISQNWEKIQRLSKVIGDLESMERTDKEDLDDSCDVEHVGKETVVKENDSLLLGEDYLPLTFDTDQEIIYNNAKMINT